MPVVAQHSTGLGSWLRRLYNRLIIFLRQVFSAAQGSLNGPGAAAGYPYALRGDALYFTASGTPYLRSPGTSSSGKSGRAAYPAHSWKGGEGRSHDRNGIPLAVSVNATSVYAVRGSENKETPPAS